MTNAEQIGEAFRAEQLRKSEMVVALGSVDEIIAETAVRTFENPLGAAIWLTSPSIVFQGRIPLDVLKTESGKTAVLQALIRIDRNIP